MKIAVEGCAHGELDKIYEALSVLETENSLKVDLLIICGDFQSVRNPTDLECMAVPRKFKVMNTFYKYYSGEKIAPVLTIFVGGNHEASNYLSELSYGGWVCPNIYYMGYANVINVGGVRIAGLSGIFKGRDYLRGHFECPPYDESSKKSVYHVRNLDVFRLKQVQSPIDICISHDWPRGVYHHGNKQDILRYKPFFREEMESNKLGSQPAEELLQLLKPTYWFAAHLHCKFTAIVPHEDKERPETKFLALDKCLPRRNFLQILQINNKSDTVQIEYDPEWLCILRSTNHLLNTQRRNSYMPGQGSNERWDFRPTNEEMVSVQQLFNHDLKVPNNFLVTAPTYHPSKPFASEKSLNTYINTQTQTLCKILNITDPFVAVTNNTSVSFSISDFSCTDTDLSYSSVPSINPEEIQCSDPEGDINESIISKSEVNATSSSNFFIDKTGSHHNTSGSSSFFIDKTGSEDDVDISDSDVFFIDKIGCRLESPNSSDIVNKRDSGDFCIDKTMSSPMPSKSTNTFLHNSQLCSTPIAGSKPREHFPEFKSEHFPEIKSEILTTQNDGTDEERVMPPFKKFRRRNFDLYKSESDVPV